MSKKSAFRAIMEGLAFERLGSAIMPLKNLYTRNATIDEIKQSIIEAAKKAKKESDEEAKKEMGLIGDGEEKGWGDAELAKQIDFIKALDIKEMFNVPRKKKK